MKIFIGIMAFIFFPTVSLSCFAIDEAEEMYQNNELTSDELFLNKFYQKITYIISFLLDIFKLFLILYFLLI